MELVVQCGRNKERRKEGRKKKRPKDMLMRRDVDDSATISDSPGLATQTDSIMEFR